ncbi:MAG: hypothetical protein GY859_28590, partial [Desulfobacterales bacterium]|nr:hypothetical protein [Desulfobacterales bacterium]
MTLHRKIQAPWGDIVNAPEVQMMEEDPAATRIVFDGNPDTAMVHQASIVTDAHGSRSLTMVFTGDNRAYIMDEKGREIGELTRFTTRATEYTTPASMPAILPPNSGYTYCAELSVDGVERVRFEKPVVALVDNFLGFDVGQAVPVGYYDRDKGAWLPCDNGVVVRLLDTDADGKTDALDADGDDLPDDLDGDGSSSDETSGLSDPAAHPPGATFWRVELRHFSPQDLNWPVYSGVDAEDPNPPADPFVDQQCDDCQSRVSSYVEERSRIFHEDIPIPGVGANLHYASNRTHGYKTIISVPASGETIPDSVKRIQTRVEVGGLVLEQELEALPNQIAEFTWDGLDHLQREVDVPLTARVSVGFVYEGVYRVAEDVDPAFAQAGAGYTEIQARQEITRWKRTAIPLRIDYGALAEGWTLSSHHYVNPVNPGILYKGDGSTVRKTTAVIDAFAGSGDKGYSGNNGSALDADMYNPAQVVLEAGGNIYIPDARNHCIRKVDANGVITRIAGVGMPLFFGDGGAARTAGLSLPSGLAADSSGNLYVADNGNHRIRKITPGGIISTIVGTGEAGFSGDNGPAVNAKIYNPSNVEFDAAGALYFSDTSNHRVRKVDPEGIITTVAGNGSADFAGDNGPAIDAELHAPAGIALDSLGNLFIADFLNFRIRKVDVEGVITTIAGVGTEGYSGDGGPAVNAELSGPVGVALGVSGNLYIAERGNDCIREVDAAGVITTVVGNGTRGDQGDGGPAADAELNSPISVTVDPAGNLYIADFDNHRVRKVTYKANPTGYIGEDEIFFTEPNGLGHIFNAAGLHQRTIDLASGVALLTFGYDPEGNLTSVTDRFGDQVVLQRGEEGLTITSPDGLSTTLAINPYTRRLTKITYPDDSFYSFQYNGNGLMTAEIEPEGNRFDHVFNADGRITGVLDEEGGHWTYAKTLETDGAVFSRTETAEGAVTSYRDLTDSTGAYTSIITGPTGAQTLFSESADGYTSEKTLPCGDELTFEHDFDKQYHYKRVSGATIKTPAGLENVTTSSRTYTHADEDGIPDLITDIATVNGKTATVVHDVLQGLKTVTTPENRTVTTEYNTNTLLTERVSAPGLLDTTFGYDARGRLTSVATGTRELSYIYNDEGFMESVTDAENHTTSYLYDEIGRVTSVDRPDESTVQFTYDKNGNMTVLTTPSTIDHEFG